MLVESNILYNLLTVEFVHRPPAQPDGVKAFPILCGFGARQCNLFRLFSLLTWYIWYVFIYQMSGQLCQVMQIILIKTVLLLPARKQVFTEYYVLSQKHCFLLESCE